MDRSLRSQLPWRKGVPPEVPRQALLLRVAGVAGILQVLLPGLAGLLREGLWVSGHLPREEKGHNLPQAEEIAEPVLVAVLPEAQPEQKQSGECAGVLWQHPLRNPADWVQGRILLCAGSSEEADQLFRAQQGQDNREAGSRVRVRGEEALRQDEDTAQWAAASATAAAADPVHNGAEGEQP